MAQNKSKELNLLTCCLLLLIMAFTRSKFIHLNVFLYKKMKKNTNQSTSLCYFKTAFYKIVPILSPNKSMNLFSSRLVLIF